jgi:hypothetical protein
MRIKRAPRIKAKQKQLVLKALTDPKFRKMLQAEPKKALGTRAVSTLNQREIALTLSMVKGIETQISALADELLCAEGPGPCGIA